MDSYAFQGVIQNNTMGIDIELPLSFHVIVNPEEDEDLVYEAAQAVIYAITEKMKREEDNSQGRFN